MPFEPDVLLADLATGLAEDRDNLIAQIHLFPLGGIEASAAFAAKARGPTDAAHDATKLTTQTERSI